jgi:hypothetical protein
MPNDGEYRAPTKARLQKLIQDEHSALIQFEHWTRRQYVVDLDPIGQRELKRAKKMWETRKRRLDTALSRITPQLQVEMKLV